MAVVFTPIPSPCTRGNASIFFPLPPIISSLKSTLPHRCLTFLSSSFCPNLNSKLQPKYKQTTQNPGTRPSFVVLGSFEAGVGVMGTKLGMMTFFHPSGTAEPVTVVGFREGNIVTQVKTEATDGYMAVQVGYRRVREKKLTKPELGHLEKAGAIPMRHLQEFRLVSVDGFHPGQRLILDQLFKEGDLVDVSGTTIGKGFQGGIKRHHFKRGPMSHGSKSHRAIGSIGSGAGRVFPGKKMPGRMGGTKTKIRKLKIVKIDNELNVVMIKGAVPGKRGNLLRITPAKIVGVLVTSPPTTTAPDCRRRRAYLCCFPSSLVGLPSDEVTLVPRLLFGFGVLLFVSWGDDY